MWAVIRKMTHPVEITREDMNPTRRTRAAACSGRRADVLELLRIMPDEASVLINGAQETVMVVNREGIVVYANPSVGRFLDVPLREILGRPVSPLLVCINTQSCLIQQFPLHDARGVVLGRVVVLRPPLPAAEAAGMADADGMAGRLLRALTRLDPHRQSFAELMPDILKMICRETGWPIGHVFVPSPDDAEVLVSAGIWYMGDRRFEEFERVTGGIRLRAGEGLPGRAMELQRPVWMTDVNLDAAFVRAALTSELGVHAGLAFPVYQRRQLLAVLEFFDTRAIRPDTALLATLEGVARQIGLLLEHRRQRTELDELAYTDALTGAGNRRRFDDALNTAYALAHKDMPCTVCMFDMDRFKSINDRFGHAEGDRVLAETAQLVRRRLRGQDVLARIGGEEFAVVMFGTSLRDARKVAEILRRGIRSNIRLHEFGAAVTASFGLAQTDVARDADGAAVLKRADAALYRAKRSGRNKVVVST